MAFGTSCRNPARRLVAGAGVALLITVGLACGGDNETDTPTTTTTTTVPAGEAPAPVKNAALNNCVSVMSGQRPAPGATVPRCVPSGTATPRR